MKWPMVELGEVAEIIMGQSPPGEYYNTDGVGKPLITGAGQFGECYPEPKQFSKSGSKVSKVGDIVICIRATIGDLNWSDKEYFLGRGVAALRPSKKMDAKYLWFWLQGNKAALESQATGSTFKQVKRSTIEEFQIPLPPLAEQQRIAAILDRADALRQKRRQAIARLDTLIQSVFLEMFGDPVMNPKGWPVVEFRDVGKNEDSKRVPVKSSEREKTTGTYPYYGASGVIDYVDDYIFEGKKLLIGEDGANLVARATPIAFIATGKFWVNNHAHVIAFNGKAELEYLEQFLLTKDLKPYVTGTAQPKLNRANLDKIKVPCPPIELQREFVSTLENVTALQEKHNDSEAYLNNLFHSLQQRAFRGELGE